MRLCEYFVKLKVKTPNTRKYKHTYTYIYIYIYINTRFQKRCNLKIYIPRLTSSFLYSSFDAFDDILSFISYKWFLINGISSVIPPRKTQIPTITRNDILPEASRVSTASMSQVLLQVVGVRKSKVYTSIEFYIYQISLSKYSFQNDYSYFSWLHYVCFLSKSANLCEYSIDVQSKWNIMFMLS